MPKIQFDTSVANGFVIDVDNDVLPVRLMEVYLFGLNQSIFLLHDRRVHCFLLCQNYTMLPLVHSIFEAVSCFICGRRRVASTRHWVICFVHVAIK